MTKATPLMSLQLQHKRYAQRAANVLGELRLDVARGEVVALLGASGCGKSTLLRIIAGIDTQFEGRLSVDGRRLAGPSTAVGIVYQEPRLFPWLSVARNVGFVAGQVFDEARVSALLARVGLAGFEERLPRQLSGGEAQRVAIARALYTQPCLLLLDEPFSALDPITRTKLQDLVLELAEEQGSSMLMVTHDVEDAALMADRVLLMAPSPGRIMLERRIEQPRPRARNDVHVIDHKHQLRAALHKHYA